MCVAILFGGHTFWLTHGSGKWTKKSRKSKYSVQLMFGEDINWTPLTPHVMRHTFASLLASKGCSLFRFAKWLGDTGATTANHYAHLMPTDPDIEKLNGVGDTRNAAIPKATQPTPEFQDCPLALPEGPAKFAPPSFFKNSRKGQKSDLLKVFPAKSSGTPGRRTAPWVRHRDPIGTRPRLPAWEILCAAERR